LADLFLVVQVVDPAGFVVFLAGLVEVLGVDMRFLGQRWRGNKTNGKPDPYGMTTRKPTPTMENKYRSRFLHYAGHQDVSGSGRKW